MNYRRPGEIHIAVAQVHCCSKLRKPAAAPYPASEDGIEESADKEFAQDKRPKSDALTDRAHDDIAGCFHEHEFEQRQAEAAGVVARPAQEESLTAQKSPTAVPQKKCVERRSSSKVRRRRVDGDCAELEGVTNGVISEQGKNKGGKIQHHQMSRILLAHQPAGEQGKSSLHEENQVSREQRPAKVGGDADVPHRVGQLHGNRFFGRLGLEIVVGFLLCHKVRAGRIWSGGGQSVAGGILNAGSIAGSDASRIRPGTRVGKAECRAYSHQQQNDCNAWHERTMQSVLCSWLSHIDSLLLLCSEWQMNFGSGLDFLAIALLRGRLVLARRFECVSPHRPV